MPQQVCNCKTSLKGLIFILLMFVIFANLNYVCDPFVETQW